MPGPEVRAFDDIGTARSWLYDGTESALKSRFPVSDAEYSLELDNVSVDRSRNYGLQAQKDALIRNDPLRVPVSGTFRLKDVASGQVLDERHGTVMNLPYVTDRGTLINNGNEYSVLNQSRLKPGVYTRRKRSGELESFINPRSGSGRTFRVMLEPKTGVFKINVGQSDVPLYPLLQAYGIKPEEFNSMWGPELVAANARAARPDAMDKLYQRMVPQLSRVEGADAAARSAAVLESIGKSELDPEVVASTLGLRNVRSINADVLRRVTQRLLAVNKGDEEPDDRDAPMFSRVLAIEDFLPERIAGDAGGLAKSLLWKARRDRNLSRMPSSPLDRYVKSFILGSRLAQPLEETNVMSLMEQMYRITKMGEGGIGDPDAVTMEAREVNPGQLGFIDPIAGPEHTGIGIDTRAAYKTFKGRDGQMHAEFIDAASGKLKLMRPEDVYGKVVGFPGQMQSDDNEVVALVGGVVKRVPRDDVDVFVPSTAHMFTPLTDLNPMPTAVQAAREFYASKFWGQYMPQARGEIPLVDTLTPDGQNTFSEVFGRRMGALTAPASGTVTKVTDDFIKVKHGDGTTTTHDTVKNLPFNRISSISYSAVVRPGDHVDKGQMLAASNFIDPKTGSLMLGQNLDVAIIPYRGLSYEDSMVISESAAKKLSTARLSGFEQEARHGIELGRSKFASMFADTLTRKQLESVDADGIVKPGTILNYGDPIILATGPKLLSPEDLQLGRLHKVLRHAVTDRSLRWEHDYPGVVVDAAKTRAGARVNVTSEQPVDIGDKLSGRFGLKGVVGHIIPDDQMPRNSKTNMPYDMLVNPMGVLSRVAAGQILEMHLGRVARATGKPVRLPQDPPPEGWSKWVKAQLEAAGADEKDTVFDPELGRMLEKPVGAGTIYVSAFHHLSEKKLSSRSGGGGSYTADELPARGGAEGQHAKRMSGMEGMQLLAHGALDVLHDSQVIRGAKNDSYWKALRQGLPLPAPSEPFVYNKFLNLLKAGGINISQKGSLLKLMPMTDAGIDSLTGPRAEIKSSAMLSDDLEPIPGGLFDPGITGGAVGKKWSFIRLSERVPNPVFEEPIRRLLGLRRSDIRDIISGDRDIGGASGGEAMYKALAGLDVDAELKKARADIGRLRGSARDNAVKVAGYMLAAKSMGTHPRDWMISKLPVLPPVFRPVNKLGDVSISADINELYRDVIEINNAVSNLSGKIGGKGVGQAKSTLYDAVSAAMGLGDPITPEGGAKGLKGALRTIIGDNPKHGFFQSRVLSKPVDSVSRAVVVPDPSLDMDSVGIPKDAAWSLYRDYVIRSLVRRGMPSHLALDSVEKRTPQAEQMLIREMDSRPVLVNRAPTWHKFNIMAFKPHIVNGSSLHFNPLATKSMTMDFDGDAVNFHVPSSDKAVAQALEKMLPSRNLFSLTDLKSPRHTPQQEMALGLYYLTQDPDRTKPERVFASKADAIAAYRRGELSVSDPISIKA